MRKNKKAMLVLLSAAMLAGAVSGCSKSSKTEGSIEFTEAASTEASTDASVEEPLPMRAMVS